MPLMPEMLVPTWVPTSVGSSIVADWTVVLTTVGAAGVTGAFGPTPLVP
jgi:hypothetical protein